MSQDFRPDSGVDDLAAFFTTPVDTPAVSLPVSEGPHSPAEGGASLADILATLQDGALPCDAPDQGGEEAARSTVVDRVVSFTVGGTVYGVRVPVIIEVGRIPAITPVPQLPPWVRGVTNLRGDVVSVIDLSALCGMDPMSLNAGRMLVARHEEEDLTVGILVERVHEIAAISPEQIRQPTAPLDGPLAPFLRGVCHRNTQVIVMLDLAALLLSPEVRQFEDLHEAPH